MTVTAIMQRVVVGADALKHKVAGDNGVAPKVDHKHKRLV